MNMLKKLIAALLVAGVAGPYGVAEEKPADKPANRADADKKSPADQLVGTYSIASGKENKTEIPAERLKDSVVTITKDKIVGVAKDKSQIFVASYTVKTGAAAGADKNVVTLMMKGEKPGDAEATGLVKIDGDTVHFVYNMPKGKPPTDFELEEGQHMFVLKRLKNDDVK